MKKSLHTLFRSLIIASLYSCDFDNSGPEIIVLSFVKSEAFYVDADNTQTLFGVYGEGELKISLDSVYLDIFTDSITYAFRKGETLSHEKGIIIQSSNQPEEVLLMLFKENDKEPYQAVIQSYDKVYKFHIDQAHNN